jgi:hypothetical protein
LVSEGEDGLGEPFAEHLAVGVAEQSSERGSGVGAERFELGGVDPELLGGGNPSVSFGAEFGCASEEFV